MTLSDLTSFAWEKYHIPERHPWSGFPGFSVLSDPENDKWLALLMRQWDSDLGEEIERCDLKCGQEIFHVFSADYLTLPFRMKGQNWVGVKMGEGTDTNLVWGLFERAVNLNHSLRYTIVLDNEPQEEQTVSYTDTPISRSAPEDSGKNPDIPGKILQMRRLYEYGPDSMEQKGKNFCRQGKFMEDYEDNQPWIGYFRHYFPTYHDLNVPQLRGYFTWRTGVRKGEYRPTSDSFAYIYLYELLNGIGTESPEDALQKMKQFETGFLEPGYGDLRMADNLHRWMRDFCVLNQVPSDTAWNYVNENMLASDLSLGVLRNTKGCSDRVIFLALCYWRGNLRNSSVIKKQREKGQHLFAEIWRRNDLFSRFFGKQRAYEWYPLSNAVRYFEHPVQNADYYLDECRSYHCRNGSWEEWRYDKLYSSQEQIQTFLRASDRILRDHLRTGHYLKPRTDEAWAEPLVKSAISAAEAAEARAEQQKRMQSVSIDFSHLEHIREDAAVTRDSLLTEEELQADNGLAPEENSLANTSTLKSSNDTEEETPVEIPGLDALHTQLLQKIVRGEPTGESLKENHLLPSLAADTINEALFDEIGDNVIECEGDEMTLVEDYREDVDQLLKGESEHE